MRARFRLGAPLLAVLAIGGCSKATHLDLGATPSARGYGQDAFELANRIQGCSGTTRVTIAAPSASSASVTSTCRLRGHRVVVYTWPDPQGETAAERALSGQGASYYAEGVGWTVILGEPTTLDVQEQTATAVAVSLHGRVVHVA